jgi:NTE family protein
MGSVIGGLYATGYNAAQIDSIFNLLILELINDFIPDLLSFYERE